VEPLSQAAAQGVSVGCTIVAIDGDSVSDLAAITVSALAHVCGARKPFVVRGRKRVFASLLVRSFFAFFFFKKFFARFDKRVQKMVSDLSACGLDEVEVAFLPPACRQARDTAVAEAAEVVAVGGSIEVSKSAAAEAANLKSGGESCNAGGSNGGGESGNRGESGIGIGNGHNRGAIGSSSGIGDGQCLDGFGGTKPTVPSNSRRNNQAVRGMVTPTPFPFPSCLFLFATTPTIVLHLRFLFLFFFSLFFFF
jgi:hypothetical protein